MTRYCIMLTGLLVSGISRAQLAKSFSIHFETNASALTARHHHFIDSIIRTLPNIPGAYAIEIKGHTDNKGSLDLNNALSKNRATAALTYLKSKQFRSTDTSLRFYAYHKPLIANTEDNLWLNRRVEINLYARKLDMVKILGIRDFMPKKYKLNEDTGGTVNYDSTRIVIAANSFLHKNGMEVTGEIDVTYMEYRNPSDFLLSGIPMSIKTGNQLSHFNSGGMFDIAAFQNGEQLVLKKQKEKTVYIKFPLSNVVEQNFYQFDTLTDQWNNNAAAITNLHGNMLFPFNGATPAADSSAKDFMRFCQCVPNGDTCGYLAYMMNKLSYFVSHEEPIRFSYPYKFIKNNLVDFKSPLYVVNIDKEKQTLTFTPKNSHNKLGVFTDYVWKYKADDYDRRLQYSFKDGVTYIKIINRTGTKFKLVIDNESFNVSGEPAGYREENAYKKPFLSFLYGGKDKAFESKLRKTNRKNFKKYLNYTQELDRQEAVLETNLRDKDELYTGSKENKYCDDSLHCLGFFYRQYLYTEDEQTLLNIYDFNLNKEKLALKLKGMPSPFTCKDAKRILIKKDSINLVIRAKRDSALNTAKLTFAKFGINSTGIYNADQVKRISDPVEILASYKTENNKPLKIISIYVSIKGLNGIINYNGYMDYGPYKFVYGKKDETMLIAVDDQEKSYYCTPAEFAAFVNARQDKTVSFILKPLRNLESAANLQKIVAK